MSACRSSACARAQQKPSEVQKVTPCDETLCHSNSNSHTPLHFRHKKSHWQFKLHVGYRLPSSATSTFSLILSASSSSASYAVPAKSPYLLSGSGSISGSSPLRAWASRDRSMVCDTRNKEKLTQLFLQVVLRMQGLYQSELWTPKHWMYVNRNVC